MIRKTEKLDILITQASQLVTAASPIPKVGSDLQDIGLIEDGAVGVKDGIIVFFGSSNEAERSFTADRILNASGKVVMPGFIDPHTHPIFVKTRENEFEMRLQGKSYKAISQTGGGIRASIHDVRNASMDELVELGLKRINKMLSMGTTTIEAKSGYGLTTESEIKMLKAIQKINELSAMEIIPTFLGAHEYPDEYKDDHEAYLDILINEMLPAVKEQNLAEYCDIFCEEHVFTVDESRRVLKKAKELGFKVRFHADELEPIGGAELAAEVNAVSADHLVAISDKGIQRLKEARVIPILLPATTFSLGLSHYAPARKMIEAGLPITLSTDFNPGSCNCDSQQLVTSIACLQMKMLPSETINAITINAAFSLERGDIIGSIEIGKQADIIILDIPSYQYLPYHLGSSSVVTVIKKGIILNN
ncbi:MAG: imidazolonepropionase [Candidatus Cloacimonetes bacterium]|nr:imidazolonepropionase [Candidatus Cloacimonadota bacterium]